MFAEPHLGLSAFTNTDLADLCSMRGLERLIVAGAITDTTLDSTARSAVERGFHVTVAADATLGSTETAQRAHTELTLPRIVHAVLPVDSILDR